MNYHHSAKNDSVFNIEEQNRKTAFNEAGYAIAIYLGNSQKNLPKVSFQICIHEQDDGHLVTKIEGGQLMNIFPCSMQEKTAKYTLLKQNTYYSALEADIINLLVGPLAEARYIALRDNEIINPCLIPFYALKNYGGESKLKTIENYLRYFDFSHDEKQQKLHELFLLAFQFIHQPYHWLAITYLANYILQYNKHKALMDISTIATVLNHDSFTKKSYYNTTVFYH